MEFSVWDLTDFLFHTLATRGKLIASLLNSTLNLGCVRLTLFWKKDKWKTGVPEYVSAFQAFCSRKQNARNNPEYMLWLHFLFEYECEKIKECGKLFLWACERTADALQGDGDWTRRSDTPEKSDNKKTRRITGLRNYAENWRKATLRLKKQTKKKRARIHGLHWIVSP